ncbi:MAG: hypothetical protein H7A36_08050 [Chlamydiales bacterium]|nr:hypothetical protein [Chlamydiales bacterium]
MTTYPWGAMMRESAIALLFWNSFLMEMLQQELLETWMPRTAIPLATQKIAKSSAIKGLFVMLLHLQRYLVVTHALWKQGMSGLVNSAAAKIVTSLFGTMRCWRKIIALLMC